MNRRKSIITIAAVALVALIGILVRQVAFAKEPAEYRFGAVTRGDMKATVSATGTLNAVTTVSVGTQVSGQVSELLVDYNDQVKKGQLLARIDPTLALQAVTDAQANLEKSQAQAVQASRDFKRNRELMDAGLVARSEYEQTQSGSEVAQAGVKSARIALDRARQNLAYTSIYAPIDGVVVERNVQQGQTVAASLSAPQLFLIANDLSQMEILAQVGESDIAQIKQGQTTEFTVQALPNRTFPGTVKQVRLQSTTQDNVVNYTVVVGVANPRAQLLPGMTARVNFLTKSAENVLKVPNAALRFKPVGSVVPGRPTRRQGTIYILDAKGTPQPIKVQTGITDGTTTEVRGDTVKEGMKVITGTLGAGQQQTAQSTTSASPFQGGQQPQRGPRGGF